MIISWFLIFLFLECVVDSPNLSFLCQNTSPNAYYKLAAFFVHQLVLNSFQKFLVDLDVPQYVTFEVKEHWRVTIVICLWSVIVGEETKSFILSMVLGIRSLFFIIVFYFVEISLFSDKSISWEFIFHERIAILESTQLLSPLSLHQSSFLENIFALRVAEFKLFLRQLFLGFILLFCALEDDSFWAGIVEVRVIEFLKWFLARKAAHSAFPDG